MKRLNLNINGVKRGLPISRPTNLILTALSDTSIKLDWDDNSLIEDGYSIERSTDGINFTEIDTVSAGVETFTDTGLTHSTTYYYRVRAFRGNKYSKYSDIASKSTWTNNLATGWTNSSTYPYETFSASGVDISSAINTTALASAYTNSFDIEIGEVYVVDLDLTINSGVAPMGLFMLNGELLAGTASNLFVFVAGSNQVEFTIPATYTNAEFILRTTASGDAQNYSITNFKIRKKL